MPFSAKQHSQVAKLKLNVLTRILRKAQKETEEDVSNTLLIRFMVHYMSPYTTYLSDAWHVCRAFCDLQEDQVMVHFPHENIHLTASSS